jgi:hypothetical protein
VLVKAHHFKKRPGIKRPDIKRPDIKRPVRTGW